MHTASSERWRRLNLNPSGPAGKERWKSRLMVSSAMESGIRWNILRIGSWWRTNMLVKRKTGQAGEVEKYTCRMVAPEFRQVKGLHYFSPTPTVASTSLTLTTAIVDGRGCDTLTASTRTSGQLYTKKYTSRQLCRASNMNTPTCSTRVYFLLFHSSSPQKKT